MDYLGKNLFPNNIPIQGESTPKIPPSTISGNDSKSNSINLYWKNWEVQQNGSGSGKGGGLVLYWKNSINLTIEDSHMYFIDTTINKNSNTGWRFTGFCGGTGHI